MFSRQIRIAIVFVVLLLSPVGCHDAAPHDAGPSQIPEFAALNDAFTGVYADRRAEVEHEFGPIIVVNFGGLELWKSGRLVERGAAMDPLYFQLRVPAHAPLAAYLLVKNALGRTLSSAEIDDINDFLDKLSAAEAALDIGDFTPAQLERQNVLFDRTRALLNNAVRNGSTNEAELTAFIRTIRKPMMDNAADAAVAQIDSYHRQMLEWHRELTDAEWQDLRVVIFGVVQARRDNVATQYFSKLLDVDEPQVGYPGESTRLYYFEYLPQQRKTNVPYADWLHEQQCKIFGTMALDGPASAAFFENPTRLRYDVMADGAREYLKTVDFSELRGGRQSASASTP